ncbi:cation diffusion facilitator family transporter [Lactococcus garvieae]|uniref:cation diffusion facilitator family transporter n=1 Tax=Lactococcus garvieae TaxID=1363 RepID=UPI00030DD395|nr:cation diffusion facilitator family transporter [Lactococcus garvieae]
MAEKEHTGGMGSVIAALGANVLVAISKFVGYALSGSAAMLNESIHSLVDCGNQVLLLFGDKRAKRAQSQAHPFGEARAKYFISMLVATFLFFGGGVIGVMEAYDKLVHPAHEVNNPLILIAILLFGMIIEGSSLRVAFKEIKALNTEKLPLFKFLHESRHSEILVIFAEDFCAIIGLILALGGTILTFLTGNPMYDALSGILIGVLLMAAAVFLVREFYSLIVGESVTASDLEKITQSFIRETVKQLIDVKTIHIGPTEILIAAKIDIPAEYEAHSYEIINAIEKDIRKALPDKKSYIYIEVDEFDNNYQH